MVLCPESKARSRSMYASRVLMGLLVLLISGRALAQEEGPREGEGAVPSGPGTGVVRQPEEQPAAPKVVPPKIVKFVNAPYPKEAEEQGLQGSVVLSLTIDKTGKVTKA